MNVIQMNKFENKIECELTFQMDKDRFLEKMKFNGLDTDEYIQIKMREAIKNWFELENI